MIIKERKFDDELSYLLQVSIRAKLSETDNESINVRIKGINGERRFDDLAIQYIKHGLILNNLQFIVNKQYFQIDTLIIMNNEIYIFEIKNIHYDIFFKDNYFYFNNGAPIEKLNEQRTRTPKLFNQLLIQNHIDLPFNYYTTFVNPDYKVYGYSSQDNVLEFHMIPKMLQTYRNW
ncbi:nuclease-related domain-containing protein [Macrococcus capreoli]|uniref:nuclease-related domain-containing protein n=1 Tax=Macrococcus capreoli TaxID=2982690 RepID=UPI003F422823